MKPADLEKDLRKRIPLAKALGLEIETATAQKAILKFPFAQNSNHVNSVFGGSLYSAGALACYALFRLISLESGLESDSLVIQEGHIDYLDPVMDNFTAVTDRPPEAEVKKFLAQLKRSGKGRLLLKASIQVRGTQKAKFEGSYVFR